MTKYGMKISGMSTIGMINSTRAISEMTGSVSTLGRMPISGITIITMKCGRMTISGMTIIRVDIG